MAQALDIGEGLSQLDSAPAGGAPHRRHERARDLRRRIRHCGPTAVHPFERLDWPLFTFYPVLEIGRVR